MFVFFLNEAKQKNLFCTTIFIYFVLILIFLLSAL